LIKQFLSSIYYAFIHHTIHVTSYMDTWHSEVRWPCWPILHIMMASVFVTELFTQVLIMSAETCRCPITL
jgi:hypothetical protein